MTRFIFFFLSVILIRSTSCHAYHNYQWQTGFPRPIHGEGAELVSQQQAFLLAQRPYLQERLAKSQPIIRWISEQVQNRQLPPLLAFIPLLESSYRLDVVSSAGAAGPWQLMPDTAKRFAVPVTTSFDGRYSLPLSTDAALTYLGWLYRFFEGDWLLALAAYNAGEGRVLNAVLKTGTRNIWALDLPAETQAYVARLIALARVIDMANTHHFQLPLWQSGNDLMVFRNPEGCSLSAWAQAKGVHMKEAKRWNPAWQHPDASEITNCPVIYSKGNKKNLTQNHVSIKLKTISLESLYDPLLLKTARGLDMSRSELKQEHQPDPLGVTQTRQLIKVP